ncbi:Uncharacterised protein [Leminorella richardii]|uniref:DUF4184 family protein n=1 Tax=Leminorella richardii TaxID=158841 RepID=A0A2X4XKW6_9GAMM|nr:DUF4184 family protein [Leminorella richardii]SQI37254.1 Uncharacterised protein [Leminorella richardii]
MPFTFAHPALVLPLRCGIGRRLSLTALLAGSLAPDLEYFVRMKVKGIYGHTPAGIFLFDIPLALLLTFIFHILIRDSLIRNLPSVLYQRLWPPCSAIDWPSYVKNQFSTVLLSLFIGTLSHLIWDMFTHRDAFFITLFEWQTVSFNLFHHQIFLYSILQHTSTLVGFSIIAGYLWRMPKKTNENSSISIIYWSALLVLTLLISAARFAWIYPHIPFGTIIVTLISSLFLALCIISLCLKGISTR